MSEGWRDIGSAPVLTEVLVFDPASASVVTAQRVMGEWLLSASDHLVDSGMGRSSVVRLYPTAWQPIPLPPA